MLFLSNLHARGYLAAETLWLLWHGKETIGYVAVSRNCRLLRVKSLLLTEEMDPVVAVAALVQATQTPYVPVRLDRPQLLCSLRPGQLPSHASKFGELYGEAPHPQPGPPSNPCKAFASIMS